MQSSESMMQKSNTCGWKAICYRCLDLTTSRSLQVTFVAYITNMARGNTNCSCTVEDGTGSIDVRVWLETGDDDTGKLSGIECVYIMRGVGIVGPKAEYFCSENVYIRVIGTLKTFANKKSINATVIKPITDHNEIHYHLLDVIRVHLNHTRGPPIVSSPGRRCNSPRCSPMIAAGQ